MVMVTKFAIARNANVAVCAATFATAPAAQKTNCDHFDPILCLYMITFVTAFTLLLYDNK